MSMLRQRDKSLVTVCFGENITEGFCTDQAI